MGVYRPSCFLSFALVKNYHNLSLGLLPFKSVKMVRDHFTLRSVSVRTNHRKHSINNNIFVFLIIKLDRTHNDTISMSG